MQKSKLIQLFTRLLTAQRGDILIPTLMFTALGFLILVPLTVLMGSGLKASQVFNEKSYTLYAADAGIEDAIWHIKYEHMTSMLSSPAKYDEFDFSTTWQYTLPEKPNGQDVTVSVRNEWIPLNIGILTPTQAQAIANNGRLLVTSGMVGGTTNQYKTTITYYPEAEETLLIDSVGIWLPPGFVFVEGSSVVEQNPSSDYYSVPTVTPHKGGYALVWDFDSVNFLDFPEVDTLDYPMTFDLSFTFTAADSDAKPDMVSWLETSGIEGMSFCWDYDVKVFKIVSQADQTSVETYVAKSELRQLNGALNGDFSATGNTLMTDAVYDYGHIRDTWMDATDHSSSSSLTDIDEDAEVAAAFLYWSGWKQESEITNVAPLNPEYCSDMADWTATAPNSWEVSSGTFRGNYESGDNRELELTDTIDLSSYSGARVALTWDQKVSGSSSYAVFQDGFTDLTNWTAGAAWTLSSGSIVGHYTGSEIEERLITSEPVDLSAFSSTITIAWNQWEGPGSLESSDELYYAVYHPVYGWSANTRVFYNDNPNYNYSTYISSYYCTSDFRIRLYLNGFAETDENCYIDNVRISVAVTPSYSDTDGLDFAIYKDDTGWSDNIEAFRGNIGTSSIKYHYFLPPQYVSDNFKLRFSVADCADIGEYVYLDNIYLKVMYPDKEIFFEINNQQVYFDEEGEPDVGYYDMTADSTDIILNITNNSYKGFSYTGFIDVTELIKTYSDGSDQLADPPVYGNGNGLYTLGHVDATLGIDGGDYQLAHAGWALIVVYTSPNTYGHQLYLYDRFTYADDYEDLDFDKNGTPGGDISGFIVPERVRNDAGELETSAAKITCFVGEGDNWISGEFIALNAPEEYWDSDTTNYPPSAIPTSYKLWDGYDDAYKNNVWNSLSLVCTADGIDVDTFDITWDSGLISEGDTSAHIDFYTNSDNWNLIFMILSFRSETTTGGSLTYLIYG